MPILATLEDEGFDYGIGAADLIAMLDDAITSCPEEVRDTVRLHVERVSGHYDGGDSFSIYIERGRTAAERAEDEKVWADRLAADRIREEVKMRDMYAQLKARYDP